MNAQRIWISLLVILICSHQLSSQNLPVNSNKPERVEWFRDLGLGLFIHWSLDSQIGSVISHTLVGASENYIEEYWKLQESFNPTDFNPDAWASLAKLAGFQYVVFTAKHHSGYCMYNTQTTDFGIMNSPFGRDITKEVIDAFRKQGIAIGLYFSPEDWHFLYKLGTMITRDARSKANPEFNPELNKYVKAQIKELLTQYGKIDIMFLDGMMSTPFLNTEFASYCWDLQPEIVVTRGGMETPEQHMPTAPIPGAWEACFTMGTQWQYKPTNEQYKSGTTVINMLLETRAKGGNLLLNIGPKPNGEIPIEQESILRELALWMMVNKKAVLNTRPHEVIRQDNIWLTKSKDGKRLYAAITDMEWKHGARKNFIIRGIKSTKDTRVSVLGHNGKVIEYSWDEDASVYWDNVQEGLSISAVRGQRLYNDFKWPNPVVIEIENFAEIKSKR